MSGLQNYLSPQETAVRSKKPFPLASIGKVESSLKNRRTRASRSKCPCVKCCNARANALPSPPSHACMIKGCSKTYTRNGILKNFEICLCQGQIIIY